MTDPVRTVLAHAPDLMVVRFAFEQAIAKTGAKYVIGEVPRPPGWSGWRITPQRFEFWHDRPFRLHDRIEFRRDGAGHAWSKVRLYP